METMASTEAPGNLRSEQDAINQLVSQLSTASTSSGPSSLSTDPSVSFNFACPVPAGEQEPGQDNQTQTTTSCTHFGDPSSLMESSSQQLSLWAHKRHSHKSQPGATCSEARARASGAYQRHSRTRSPVDGTAQSSAWRAPTCLQPRDHCLVETGSSVWRNPQHHKSGTRTQQAARRALHSTESRADSTSSRLHSRTHGPVGPTAAAASMLHSRSSARQHKPSKASKLPSKPSPMHRHTPAARRAPAVKQRAVQPRCPPHLVQSGPSGAAAGAPVISNPIPETLPEEGSGNNSVEKMQELSRLLHQVILLHTGDGSPLSSTTKDTEHAEQRLAPAGSQMDSVELSSILHDAEQLVAQVRQSPSLAASMNGDPLSSSLSYTPSISPSRLAACEEAAQSPPKLPTTAPQPMMSSPDPALERLAEGTTSMEGISTPCCSSSHTGTQGVDASAVASSPVAASASSLSSDISGMGESLELFLPAPLALPLACAAEQDRNRQDSNKLRAVGHSSQMDTPHEPETATAKSVKSHSGSLGPVSGSLTSAAEKQHSVNHSCCKSPPFPLTPDTEGAALSPPTPELMSLAHESASTMKQAGNRWDRDALDSSDRQSSTVPAEWQVTEDPSCSGTGSSLETDRSTCEPAASRIASVHSNPAEQQSGEVRRQDTGGITVPAHLRRESTARKGDAVLPEGFCGEVPENLLSKVLPASNARPNRSTPVYVVPVYPQPQAQGFTKRAAQLWKSMFRKQEQPAKSCKLSKPSARSPLSREQAAVRLHNSNRSSQQTPAPEHDSDETFIFCACF